MTLLFVPVSTAELGQWVGSGVLPGPRQGFAVTPGLIGAFALADQEQAEHVAVLVASVAALARTGRRLVAVVEGAGRPSQDGDPDFGEVVLGEVRYRDVTSLFADEPGAVGLAEAAAAAAGRSLAQAWDEPAVMRVLENADLLWHGPTEWGLLVAG